MKIRGPTLPRKIGEEDAMTADSFLKMSGDGDEEDDDIAPPPNQQHVVGGRFR